MTVDDAEVLKFSKSSWWDEKNPEFSMLHLMNPFRINYILNSVANLDCKKILDVGCGGGILSLPLARLGFDVTGIDANQVAIDIAKKQADGFGLNVKFQNCTIEDFNHEEKFDLILAMDILEHVSDPDIFLNHCKKHLKQGGILVVSTISDSLFSKIFVKYIAEYVLSIVPKDTHDCKKFVSPERLNKIMCDFERLDVSGFVYNPILKKFSYTQKSCMNYFASYKKR